MSNFNFTADDVDLVYEALELFDDDTELFYFYVCLELLTSTKQRISFKSKLETFNYHSLVPYCRRVLDRKKSIEKFMKVAKYAKDCR